LKKRCLAARGLLPWPREGFCPGRARASALAARGLLPWPREGFCPGGRIPKPGLSYGFIPAISLELLFRLAGIHVPAQTIAGMTFFLILCFSGSKNI
jgi:hypothetical protein